MMSADLATVRQNSDFFTFFHLQSTGPVAAPGVVDFRPIGSDFAQFVDVTVTVDASDRITAMTLTLARSFIDDSATAPFARDIAKSFLKGAPSQADAQQVSPLANDIERGIAQGYTPQTSAYGAFAGVSQTPVTLDMTNARFDMAPANAGGAPALALSFTAH
jgi:hypothetical protein